MELPQYTLKPSIRRIVAPKIINLIFLGVLFYYGIWLNVYLLDKKIPGSINVLVILLIFGLLMLQVAITYIKFSNTKYFFFSDRIEYKGKKPTVFYFTNAQRIYVKRNPIDKILGTGNIMIDPNFQMKFIANANQIYNYTQSLIQRIKGYYQQYG